MRWQQDVLLPSLATLAELSWLAVWLHLVFMRDDGEAVIGFWPLVVVASFGVAVMRWASARHWSIGRIQGWVIALGFGAVWLGIALAYGPLWWQAALKLAQNPVYGWTPETLAVVPTAFLFWRGLRIGEKPLDALVIEEKFRGGALALGLLMIAAPFSTSFRDASAVLAALPGAALLFFATSLSALAIARLRSLGQRGVSSNATLQRWMATLVLTVGAIVVAGLVIVAVAPGPLGGIAQALRPLVGVFAIVDAVLTAVLLPILLLLEPIFEALQRLFQRFGINLNLPADQGLQPEEAQRIVYDTLSSDAGRFITWLIILTAVTLIVLLVLALLRRRRDRADPPDDETRETVFRWRDLWSQLMTAVRAWMRRRRERPAASVPRVVERPTTAEARSVREAYRQFLRETASVGIVRRPETTPLEFAGVVSPVIARAAPSVHALTNAYQRARYADAAMTPEDVARATTAATRVGEALRDRVEVSKQSLP